MHPPDPDPLERLAADWHVSADPDPALRRKVRARLAAAEARRPATRLAAWLAEFVALVRQPAVLGFVVFCILLGLASAELRATRTPFQDVGRVATLYLQAINPLLRTGAGDQP